MIIYSMSKNSKENSTLVVYDNISQNQEIYLKKEESLWGKKRLAKRGEN